MNSEQVAKYVKAGAAILSAAGVVVSPESVEAITGGFFALYSVVTVIQGKFFKAK